MWSPTHVQVLVKSAKGLNIKGKNGTNDAFVTIAMGKEKYQTSVKEKATENVEWREQCELTIPENGNKAEIVLTALHRNFLGVDEFLGQVNIALRDFDYYEKPKTKWYELKCKPGQNKTDYRGELEVRTSFTVKSVSKEDLTEKKKTKGSLQSLNKAGSKIGGSLMSLGTKEKKNIKKLAKTVGKKVEKVTEKTKKSLSRSNLSKDGNVEEVSNPNYSSSTLPNKVKVKDFDLDSSFDSKNSFRRVGSGKNRDPGVQSDEEEEDMFKFDQLSHRSSGSSLNVTAGNLGYVSKNSTPISGSFDNVGGGGNDLYKKSFGTPLGGRKEPGSNITTPKSSRSFLLDSGNRGSGRSSSSNKRYSGNDQVLDEWEAKLLGKKETVPYKKPEADTRSTISQLSRGSQNSFSAADRGRGNLPEPQPRHKLSNANLTPPQETPTGRKKIIPVNSDLEGTPSPEDSPSSPFESPIASNKKTSDKDLNGSYQPNSKPLASNKSFDNYDVDQPKPQDKEKKSKTIGLKLKNSYRNLVETGKSGSLFNLSQIGRGSGRGFSQRDDKRGLSSSRDLRMSTESLGGMGTHSRAQSDSSGVFPASGSSGAFPPSGARVVVGRETTPTPNCNQPSRLPKDLWLKFDGKSREDLIEMIVGLQDRVEAQAKKQGDLENYIDTLLTKVIANAPELLQKNSQMDARFGKSIK